LGEDVDCQLDRVNFGLFSVKNLQLFCVSHQHFRPTNGEVEPYALDVG
jgi:hypothetical protein